MSSVLRSVLAVYFGCALATLAGSSSSIITDDDTITPAAVECEHEVTWSHVNQSCGDDHYYYYTPTIAIQTLSSYEDAYHPSITENSYYSEIALSIQANHDVIITPYCVSLNLAVSSSILLDLAHEWLSNSLAWPERHQIGDIMTFGRKSQSDYITFPQHCVFSPNGTNALILLFNTDFEAYSIETQNYSHCASSSPLTNTISTLHTLYEREGCSDNSPIVSSNTQWNLQIINQSAPASSLTLSQLSKQPNEAQSSTQVTQWLILCLITIVLIINMACCGFVWYFYPMHLRQRALIPIDTISTKDDPLLIISHHSSHSQSPNTSDTVLESATRHATPDTVLESLDETPKTTLDSPILPITNTATMRIHNMKSAASTNKLINNASSSSFSATSCTTTDSMDSSYYSNTTMPSPVDTITTTEAQLPLQRQSTKYLHTYAKESGKGIVWVNTAYFDSNHSADENNLFHMPLHPALVPTTSTASPVTSILVKKRESKLEDDSLSLLEIFQDDLQTSCGSSPVVQKRKYTALAKVDKLRILLPPKSCSSRVVKKGGEEEGKRPSMYASRSENSTGTPLSAISLSEDDGLFGSPSVNARNSAGTFVMDPIDENEETPVMHKQLAMMCMGSNDTLFGADGHSPATYTPGGVIRVLQDARFGGVGKRGFLLSASPTVDTPSPPSIRLGAMGKGEDCERGAYCMVGRMEEDLGSSVSCQADFALSR